MNKYGPRIRRHTPYPATETSRSPQPKQLRPCPFRVLLRGQVERRCWIGGAVAQLGGSKLLSSGQGIFVWLVLPCRQSSRPIDRSSKDTAMKLHGYPNIVCIKTSVEFQCRSLAKGVNVFVARPDLLEMASLTPLVEQLAY